ncbi:MULTISPECIES: hypothetical protein [unclassified Microbacterium]|uniref:hypothetical protein n=1 Tax=unclassified Microbacterium TaxID=2609290 RepID=UPI0030104977
MKKPLTAVLALTIGLALAGCAGTPEAADAPLTATPSTPATQSASPTPPPSDGPVEVTTSPTATDSEAPLADQWIAGTTEWFAGKGVVITEDQVRAAANFACDQLDAGVDISSIQPLTGDVDPEVVSTFMANMSTYCPMR